MKHLKPVTLLALLTMMIFSCKGQDSKTGIDNEKTLKKIETQHLDEYPVAYFASGCFWCVEAIFESMPGVVEVISGYSGGESPLINYQISNYGNTGHAEAVAVYYESDKISFPELVQVYFLSQDPTQKMGQGPDCGPQYRSILFFQNETEKEIIENAIEEMERKGVPVAAEIMPFDFFVVAEDYHQDYKKRNPNNPYIKNVSDKRYKKFKQKYSESKK